MAKIKTLTDVGVRACKPKLDKRGKPARAQYHFGDGLYVIVQPSGTKSFALRYRRDGRQMKHTLGQYFDGDISKAPPPKVGGLLTIAGAKKLAADALLEIDTGNDPIESHRRVK